MHIRLAKPPARALRPVIPNNACPPRITAAAGTELAGAYSLGTVSSRLYYVRLVSSLRKEFYTPKSFFTHAALLGQAFAHCPIFPTAASHRSLGRISVPVWPFTLSGRLLIIALVSRYLTNKLIRRKLILYRKLKRGHLSSLLPAGQRRHSVLATLSHSYPKVKGRLLTRYSPVRH